MLISFSSGVCVEDVVNIQANYQFTSVIVMHFMNDAGVCVSWVIQRTAFDVYICLNLSSRYKPYKLGKCHEKPTHQKVVFSKFRQFS